MSWLREIDDLLRGNKSDPKLLALGTEHIRLAPYVVASIVLGVIYGIAMGLYAVLTRTPACWEQMLASAVKVPALFYLTLLVTFPSLYVFSALLGARLTLADTLRVIVASLAVNLVVLASFAPITAFFTLNTTSYPFMKLLNVFFFTVAGFIGLGFLLTVLKRMEFARSMAEFPAAPASPPAADGTPPVPAAVPVQSAPMRGVSARRVFRVWLVVFAVVGAQMGWVLRPFVGAPNLEFTWFRAREANFFLDVLRTLRHLFGG
jgi:hypothetical protein